MFATYSPWEMGPYKVGITASCKEEIAEDAIHNHTTQLIVRTRKAISNAKISQVVSFIRRKEKKLHISKKTTIQRVADDDRFLFITHSQVWSKNECAYSLFLTWLRRELKKAMGLIGGKDSIQLMKAKWIVSVVEKHGIAILGHKKHRYASGGMCEITKNLKRGTNYFGDLPANEDLLPDDGPRREYESLRKLYDKEHPKQKNKAWAK